MYEHNILVLAFQLKLKVIAAKCLFLNILIAFDSSWLGLGFVLQITANLHQSCR